MSKFRLAVTIFFGIFIVIGLIVFAVVRTGSNTPVSRAVIWGTFDSKNFGQALEDSGIAGDETFEVTYVQKDPENFDFEFIEALARGEGPDIILIPHNSVLRHENKLYKISYESLSQRDFKDIFMEEGELYLTSSGILGVPMLVDPMVMYWNRDILNNANITQPPTRWGQFYSLAEKITKKDQAFTISQSAIPFGESNNVDHFKDIISMLIQQAGNDIVGFKQGKLQSLLIEKENSVLQPSIAALTFYTEFSNPVKPFYSWNRSLPSSRDFFLSGDLALYFGFASEIFSLRQKAPNLNFDVAHVPLGDNDQTVTTFGRMYGLSITRQAKDVAGAIRIISALTSTSSNVIFSRYIGMAPVRRDVLSEPQTDAYRSVFYESALHSRAWLDPNPDRTNQIFSDMITSVTAGRLKPSEAVGRASSELNALLGNSI